MSHRGSSPALNRPRHLETAASKTADRKSPNSETTAQERMNFVHPVLFRVYSSIFQEAGNRWNMVELL